MHDDLVEEIGGHLVVQVITDNTSAYVAVGRMLMEKGKHLYWTPYATHYLDLMFEKIGELPQHKNALLKTKRVSNFIYRHPLVLDLMRTYGKSEIVGPTVTRFATTFLTLQSIYQLKQPLEAMFTSEE